MSRNGGNGDWIAFSIGSVVLAAFLIMSAFNVPFKVAIDSMPGFVSWIIALLASIYFGLFIFLSPALFGLLVKVMQPILNFWAGTDGDGISRIDPPWYGVTGWQITLALGITIGGYAIMFWRKRRY